MDYHVLTYTKDINLDRLILIQFLELKKFKKTNNKQRKTKSKIKTKPTTRKKNNKAKQNKVLHLYSVWFDLLLDNV
jgi:hypothetical protein